MQVFSLFRALLAIIVTLLLPPYHPGMGEESIEQLLEQVDRTLNTKAPTESPKPLKAPRSPSPTERTEPKTTEPAQPLSVPYLFNVPAETTAVKSVDRRLPSRIAAGFASRSIDSVSRLEKDDDTFTIDGVQRLQGATLTFDHQILDIRVGPHTLGFFAGGGVSVFSGAVNVRRRGVFNEDLVAELSLIPWHAGCGLRYPANRPLFFEASVQAIVEAMNQNGSGVSDTVANILPGDAINLGVGYRLGERFAALINWQKRGIAINGPQSAVPGSSASIALGAYL